MSTPSTNPLPTLQARLVTLSVANPRKLRRRSPKAKAYREGVLPLYSHPLKHIVLGADQYDIINAPDDGNSNLGLVFGGGAVIPQASVEMIFWGSVWNDPATTPSAGQILNAMATMLAGPYMTGLAQYGIGRASLRDSGIVVDVGLPNPFSRDDWHNLIWDLIDQGTFPEPDDDGGRNLYVIVAPPGVEYNVAGVGGHMVTPVITILLSIPIAHGRDSF